MKKAYKVILVGALVLSAFVPVLVGTANAQDEPVVITMWHDAAEADPFFAVLPPAIERFNATHDDVQIEGTAVDVDALKMQLSVAIAAGEPPDIFMTWGGGLLKSYVDAGIVRAIPELDDETADKFIEGGLSPSTFDDVHYAVPGTLTGIFLYYNKALFEEAELEPPATWEDLVASCEVFNDKGIVPVALGNVNRWTGSFWFMNLNLRLGGPDAFLNAYDRTGSFADPVFVESGELLQDAVRADCFGEGFNGMDYTDEQVLFGTGMAAMELQGDWNYAGLLNIDPELAREDVGIIMFPPVAESEDGDPLALVGGTGVAYAISTTAPEETAAALIELLTDDEFGKSCGEHGFISALKGYDQYIEEPAVQHMVEMLSEATFVQVAYDQFLPSELAQVHLDTTQALFGLSVTPEEAAAQTEESAVETLGPSK